MEHLTGEIAAHEAHYYRLEGRLNRPAVSQLRRKLTGDTAARVVLVHFGIELAEDGSIHPRPLKRSA